MPDGIQYMDEQMEGSVAVLTKEEANTQDDPGKYSHIVKGKPGQTAAATVTEALIFGTEVEALCGYRWVPSKDPKKYPVCPKCKEIHELYKSLYNKDFPIQGS